MSEQLMPTYCRICEAACGMVATVRDGNLIQLRPDHSHEITQGFACPKGIAMTEIVNDPDRILHPLRRRAGAVAGPATLEDFERVTWEEALRDVGARTRRTLERWGPASIGGVYGDPLSHSYANGMWTREFFAGLGSPHLYSANCADAASRFATSAFLYGSSLTVPIPDVYRTQFLLIVGANPMVSHGSLMSGKRLLDRLRDIPKRGGRIVVLDPRRTETAREFEHIPIRPDSDAWLLLAMLNVIFTEGLADQGAIARQSRGIEALQQMVASYTPENTATHTQIPATLARQLALDFARAPSAIAYGRCGSNRGRHGTLVAYLLDALTLVTGNLDREGGALFGSSLMPAAAAKSADSYGKKRTRIGNFPDTFGTLPSNMLAKEITTPGDGQIRVLFTIAANPIQAGANPLEMVEALRSLDLHVAIDIYLSDTAQYADYVLPGVTMFEREDINIGLEMFQLTPFVEYTEPVIAPRGEAREEWRILEDIAKNIGFVPSGMKLLRVLGKFGVRPSPRQIADTLLRLGPYGDLFGLKRDGLSLAKLKRSHRRVLAETTPAGRLAGKIGHKDHLVHLDAPEILAEARELGRRNLPDRASFPMTLISMRDLRSHNTWMHNSPKMMAGKRSHAARINPDDAHDLGIGEGEHIRVTSPTGSIEIAVRITDEMMPGVLAIPHGWGQPRGLKVAHKAGGANVNALASTSIEDIEPLGGMTLIDGIPVRVERLAREPSTCS